MGDTPKDVQPTVEVGGVPFRVSDQDQLVSALEHGAKPVSNQEAIQSEAAQRDLGYVDQNWGVAGKLGMGLASGLSLGTAPGLAANLGLVDPGHVKAAQTSPFYTAGDVAGTLLPALATGGEGLAARGLGLTPAGLLELAGSGTERLVGSVLGESAGVLGRLGTTAAQMAARGAVDGAAINLGHTVGDALLDNKPLAAESLLASGADGALLGALIGGSVGTVGSLGSLAVENVSKLAGSAASRTGAGAVGRRLGQSAEDLAENTAKYGTAGYHTKINDILEHGGTGAKIGSSDSKLAEGFQAGRKAYEADRVSVVERLDKEAPSVSPSVERIQQRLESTVLAPRVGTGAENDAANAIAAVNKDLEKLTSYQELNPVKVAPTKAKKPRADLDPYELMQFRQKYPDVETPGYEIMGGRFPTGELPSWKKWIETRDYLEKKLTKSGSDLKSEILNTIDDEIKAAMDHASQTPGLEGLSDKYSAATTLGKMAESLEKSVGKKAADSMLKSEPSITVQDAAYALGGMALGHPVPSLAWLAGKGLVRKLKGKLEPTMAQMAFDASIGTKASAATANVRNRIGESVKKFFSVAAKSPTKAYQVNHAENRRTPVTRKSYEESYSRAEQLLSTAHQDKVRRYAETLYDMGYEDLAKSITETNNRAVQYLMWNQPSRKSAKAINSLRPFPVSKVPDMHEYKFMRQLSAITDPMSVVEGLEKGTVSRDQLMAMKYVYPELHNELVYQYTSKIAEMKSEGKYLPMSKITLLGLAFDAPVDSTQEPEYVTAVQQALAATGQGRQGQPSPQQQNQSMAQYSQDLLTPMEKIQQV